MLLQNWTFLCLVRKFPLFNTKVIKSYLLYFCNAKYLNQPVDDLSLNDPCLSSDTQDSTDEWRICWMIFLEAGASLTDQKRPDSDI